MDIFGLPVDLVILDVDGVILDILKVLQKNLEDTASCLGLPLGPVAISLEQIAQGKMRIKGNAHDSTRMIWPHLDDKEVDAFVDLFHQIERTREYDPIEGSIEAISFFREHGVAVALATNNPTDVLEWRFAAARIDPAWFAAVVTRDNAYFKPHPQTFDPIFEAVCISRDRALYVGDLQIDWDMARGANVRFFAVLTGGVPREAFLDEGVSETHIFNRLSDILMHIEW